MPGAQGRCRAGMWGGNPRRGGGAWPPAPPPPPPPRTPAVASPAPEGARQIFSDALQRAALVRKGGTEAPAPFQHLPAQRAHGPPWAPHAEAAAHPALTGAKPERPAWHVPCRGGPGFFTAGRRRGHDPAETLLQATSRKIRQQLLPWPSLCPSPSRKHGILHQTGCQLSCGENSNVTRRGQIWALSWGKSKSSEGRHTGGPKRRAHPWPCAH